MISWFWKFKFEERKLSCYSQNVLLRMQLLRTGNAFVRKFNKCTVSPGHVKNDIARETSSSNNWLKAEAFFKNHLLVWLSRRGFRAHCQRIADLLVDSGFLHGSSGPVQNCVPSAAYTSSTFFATLQSLVLALSLFVEEKVAMTLFQAGPFNIFLSSSHDCFFNVIVACSEPTNFKSKYTMSTVCFDNVFHFITSLCSNAPEVLQLSVLEISGKLLGPRHPTSNALRISMIELTSSSCWLTLMIEIWTVYECPSHGRRKRLEIFWKWRVLGFFPLLVSETLSVFLSQSILYFNYVARRRKT